MDFKVALQHLLGEVMGIRKTVFFVAALIVCGSVFAQQKITNFGVIDTERVYAAFSHNSAKMKNYEKAQSDVQAELDRRTEEIRAIQTKIQEAQELNLSDDVKKYQNELRTKAAALKTYKDSKEKELASMKKSLSQNDEFYKKLNSTLRRIAENEGLSMILNVDNNQFILWYSPAVDITDKVIDALSR